MTRTQHYSHPTKSFPVYCLDWTEDRTVLLGGGGGASRSGIANKFVSGNKLAERVGSALSALLCSAPLCDLSRRGAKQYPTRWDRFGLGATQEDGRDGGQRTCRRDSTRITTDAAETRKGVPGRTARRARGRARPEQPGGRAHDARAGPECEYEYGSGDGARGGNEGAAASLCPFPRHWFNPRCDSAHSDRRG